jgi:hypothetical protein
MQRREIKRERIGVRQGRARGRRTVRRLTESNKNSWTLHEYIRRAISLIAWEPWQLARVSENTPPPPPAFSPFTGDSIKSPSCLSADLHLAADLAQCRNAVSSSRPNRVAPAGSSLLVRHNVFFRVYDKVRIPSRPIYDPVTLMGYMPSRYRFV